MENLINFEENETSSEKLSKNSKSPLLKQNLQNIHSLLVNDRLSLDLNNPFDKMEYKSVHSNDPFECLEKKKMTSSQKKSKDEIELNDQKSLNETM